MKRIRLVVLAVVLAAMVGMACLCIFAAEPSSVQVMSANLSLQDNAYMYFSVAYDNIDPDKDTCGVIFWTAEQEDYNWRQLLGMLPRKSLQSRTAGVRMSGWGKSWVSSPMACRPRK